METIQAFALPDLHEHFYSFFEKFADKNKTILDYGAGAGAFSQRLYSKGFNVSACDYAPSLFKLKEVDCLAVENNKTLFADNSFDIIVAIEVFEHLFEINSFFQECDRLLKKDGILLISTPNIMSFKSRIKFLLTGHFYSFPQLDFDDFSGMQHVNPMTIDRIEYFARMGNFKIVYTQIDKKQQTSLFFLPLFPFIKNDDLLHPNNGDLLFGRTLFAAFNKIK